MKNIIQTIINRTCKQVVILHRMGHYFSIGEVTQMIYDELYKQNINVPLTVWVFDKSIPVDDYIKQEIRSRLKYKLKDYLN